MAVRSKRLWGPTAVGTVNVSLYTAPAGETALVKHLSIVSANALVQVVTFRINGTGAANDVAHISVPALGDVQLPSWFWVLNPGDVLRAVGSRGDLNVAGFGAELEGSAD